MNSHIFCVHDKGAEQYLEPWMLPTKELALRAFSDCVNKDGHNFNLHPDQYTLFHIGEFDGDRGMVLPQSPESLCNGVSVKKPVEKPLLVSSDIVEAVEKRVAQLMETEQVKIERLLREQDDKFEMLRVAMREQEALARQINGVDS